MIQGYTANAGDNGVGGISGNGLYSVINNASMDTIIITIFISLLLVMFFLVLYFRERTGEFDCNGFWRRPVWTRAANAKNTF